MVIFRKPRSVDTARPPASGGAADWPLYFFIAAGVALFMLLSPLGADAPRLILRDPDNYMRLVQVRDLLTGQSWWDMTQYRMADGVTMHWSRWADLPLAILITFFSLFVERAQAEIAAVVVLPPLLFAPTLLFLSLTARNLSGVTAEKIARILALTVPMFIAQYVPGRIDHHPLQLMLLAGALAALSGRETVRNGALAALATALSLSIGLETAPVLAAGVAWLALRWAWLGEECAAKALGFSLALAVAVPLAHALSVPHSDWLRASADQLGRGHLAVVVVAALALALAVKWPAPTAPGRFAGLVAVSVAGLVPIALFPETIATPYAAMDPQLRALWLDNIVETASVFDTMRDRPEDLLTFFLFPLLALGAAIHLFHKATSRSLHALIVAMLAAALVVALWQIRASTAVSMLAVVPASAFIASCWQRRKRRHGIALTGLAALALNGWTGPVILELLPDRTSPQQPATSSRDAPLSPTAACERAVQQARLDRFDPGMVLSGIDVGAALLAHSDHSILASAYHRNERGNLAMFRILMAEPDGARAVLEREGIDYVFYCPSAEFRGIPGGSANGLGLAIARGDPPAWLELLDRAREGGWAFYAVR